MVTRIQNFEVHFQKQIETVAPDVYPRKAQAKCPRFVFIHSSSIAIANGLCRSSRKLFIVLALNLLKVKYILTLSFQ